MWAAGGGAMGGGGFGRGGASVGGLPFGGIPSELQKGVDKLLAEEPESELPELTFEHRASEQDKRQLSLWGLLTQYPRRLATAGILVVVIAFATQARPKFTEIAVNDGMSPGHKHFDLVIIMAASYLASIVITAYSQRTQVKVTGRL